MSLYVSQRLGRGLSIGSRTSPLALLFIIPLWLGKVCATCLYSTQVRT